MEQKYKIIITPHAKSQIAQIYEYICHFLYNKTAADELMNEIANALKTVELFPRIFPVLDIEPFKTRGLRKIVINHYYLYYLIKDEIK